MRDTIFCNHYRAMSSNTTCSAGVSYDSLKGIPFDSRPCFCEPGKPAKPGCDLVQLPTPEQLAKEEAEMEARIVSLGKAREAIVAHLGGKWKRGTSGASGKIDCPVCGVAKALRFYRSGYNGHIHAACATENCVSWME